MYWDRDIETMERAALQRLQCDRLAAMLSRATQAPFYRGLLGSRGW